MRQENLEDSAQLTPGNQALITCSGYSYQEMNPFTLLVLGPFQTGNGFRDQLHGVEQGASRFPEKRQLLDVVPKWLRDRITHYVYRDWFSGLNSIDVLDQCNQARLKLFNSGKENQRQALGSDRSILLQCFDIALLQAQRHSYRDADRNDASDRLHPRSPLALSKARPANTVKTEARTHAVPRSLEAQA